MKKTLIVFIFLMFLICFVGCSNTKKSQLNKENLRQELKSYVDEIDKAKNIKLCMDPIYEFIDKNVDSISEKDYKNKSMEIKNSIKGEIDKLVLTKELEDEMIVDFEKYGKYAGNLNNNGICYGIYNGAVVVLLVLPSDIIGHLVIKNFDFIYPSDFVILTWKDHKFYSFGIEKDVTDLLENRILSMDDISSIYKIHNELINDWKNTFKSE